MKKTRLCLLSTIILLAALSSLGCGQPVKQPEQINNGNPGTPYENPLVEEDKSMSTESLLTKDELLEFIKMNDTGLTEEDFADIEADDFIEHTRLSKSRLATVNIKNRLELYKNSLKRREFEPYEAKEIISVDSGSEEFELFKTKFFCAIETEAHYIGKSEGYIDRFHLTINDEKVYIEIGQTQNLDKLEFYTFPDGTLGITQYHGGETFVNNSFCYSKNKKYFMVMPASMEILEAFCEIDD